jgi:hypothetical protein
MTDKELYDDCIKKFEKVEQMIDEEFSSREETAPLIIAIEMLYSRILELRQYCRF